MTTAQERRRARRLARKAAQGLDSPPADAVVATEDPTATGGPETMLIPPTDPTDQIEPPAVDLPEPEPEQPPVTPVLADPSAPAGGGHRWNRVTARPSPVPARARTGERPHGWVAVKPRRVSADATEMRTAEPPVSETIAPLPTESHEVREARDAHDSHSARATNGHAFADGNPAPPARALHPRSRAIRITRVKTNGRRRWSVDFLVRKPDDANQA